MVTLDKKNKRMSDINSIACQIKHNCNISDAKYWGFYSPCGLLLRLRDLYRIENGLKPWVSIDHEEVGDWISDKEEMWKELDTFDLQNIGIGSKNYRPFDVKGINMALANYGLLYGAGYGNFSKPVFLLAELSEVIRTGQHSIYISDREIARDISADLAMLQGSRIIVRRETVKLFLWGKLEEMRAGKNDGPLLHAFSEYGVSREDVSDPDELENQLDRITREEISTYINHELGEASQKRILGKWWEDLVIKLPYSRAELFIRGLKDVLSDTCDRGTLTYIIKNRKAGSLSFYVALLSGFRKSIFPDIVTAYNEFKTARSWDVIEGARITGYKRTKSYIKILRALVDQSRTSPEEIERGLISKIV